MFSLAASSTLHDPIAYGFLPNMKIVLLLFWLAAFIPLARAADIPVEHGSNTVPIISVHFAGGLPHETDEAVIACIWADGRIVWSHDRDLGGSPFFSAQINSKQLKAFFTALHARGIFARKEWFSIITDGPTFTINVIDGPRCVLAVTSFYGSERAKFPKHITDQIEAVVFLRQKIEALIPTKGPKVRFKYDLRPLK